jgi:ABC-type bacteriocin/lantibiotic exporter with double-glycine peptidase domain
MSASVPPVRRLFRHLQIERPIIFSIIIYSAAIGLLSLALPIATQSLVNTIAFGNVYQPIVVLSIILAIVLIAAAVLQSLRVWVVEVLQQRLFVRVASDTIHRLLRARSEAFSEHHGPELVNRFFDVVTVQKSASTLLIDGLTVVMQSGIGLILLGLYHPWLLAFAFLLLGAILFIIFPLGRGAVYTAVNESKAKYSLVAWFEEVARHAVTFKSPDAAILALTRTDSLTAEYLSYRRKHFRILFRQIVGSYGLYAIASAALLGVGGFLVISRQLTLGQLVAAELVVGMVVTGFSKLGKHLEIYYDLLAAMDKLGYIEDLPLEPQPEVEAATQSRAPASVLLRDVTLAYGTKTVLSNAWMEIRSGRRIGLSGLSGNGKSSLLDLLYGLREPDAGTVEIDSADLRDWNRAQLRQEVALVRTAEIFEGTILENVRLGKQDADVSEVRWALSQVGLLEEVLALPEGLSTKLSTGGRPLSEGQAMRLVFARALLRRPRLLLVDEALDFLGDTPSRDTLLTTLFADDQPWTLVVASADSQLLRRCDAVYEIQDRQVVKR